MDNPSALSWTIRRHGHGQYADIKIGLSDASVAVLATRHRTTREWLSTRDEDWRRALRAQAARWHAAQVREVGLPDLLIAAVAERERVTVRRHHNQPACPFKHWLVVLCRADDVVVRGRSRSVTAGGPDNAMVPARRARVAAPGLRDGAARDDPLGRLAGDFGDQLVVGVVMRSSPALSAWSTTCRHERSASSKRY
jgi:hypothetical protein